MNQPLDTDADAREVLCQYPAGFGGARLTPLGNAGGFSGARLWRVDLDSSSWCLKAWPADSIRRSRLTRIHCLMQKARQAGLAFIPAVLPVNAEATGIEWKERIWDLQEWMPGTADAQPSRAKVEAACFALAQLHHVWADDTHGVSGCPAVRRRLDSYQDWSALRAAEWRPTPRGIHALDALAARAWELLLRQMPRVPATLAPWVDRRALVHPCLCDVWHAHVLYEGERVTGILDFGSVKHDHFIVDLARFLGSSAREDSSLWTAGLQSYARVRLVSAEDETLAHVLDRSGVLVGLFNWIKWLYREGRRYHDPAAVATRLEELVARARCLDGSFRAN